MNAEQYLNELPDTFRGMLDRLAHSPRDGRVPEWLRRAFVLWEEESTPLTDHAWRAKELLVFADLISAHGLIKEFVISFLDADLAEVPELKERLVRLKFITAVAA